MVFCMGMQGFGTRKVGALLMFGLGSTDRSLVKVQFKTRR